MVLCVSIVNIAFIYNNKYYNENKTEEMVNRNMEERREAMKGLQYRREKKQFNLNLKFLFKNNSKNPVNNYNNSNNKGNPSIHSLIHYYYHGEFLLFSVMKYIQDASEPYLECIATWLTATWLTAVWLSAAVSSQDRK